MRLLALKPEKSQANWDEMVTPTLTQAWPIRATFVPLTTRIHSIMGNGDMPWARLKRFNPDTFVEAIEKESVFQQEQLN